VAAAAAAAAVFFKIQNHHPEANLFKFCSLHNVHKRYDIEAVWSTAAAPFIQAFL